MVLTDTQVENWRRVLIGTLGPYALMMSREEIELLHAMFQFRLSETEPVTREEPFCGCDRSYYGATVRKDGVSVCNHCKKERS